MELYVYTDGGIEPGAVPGQGRCGGAGVVLAASSGGTTTILTEASFHFDQTVTNQVMEIEAARLGLDLVKQLMATQPKYAKAKTFLCSDSAYVINCLNDGWYATWMLKSGWRNAAKKQVENADLWRGLLSSWAGAHDRIATQLGPSPWRKMDGADAAVIRESAFGVRATPTKVKGHSTDALNNLADALATAGKRGTTDVRWHTGATDA